MMRKMKATRKIKMFSELQLFCISGVEIQMKRIYNPGLLDCCSVLRK